MPAKVSKDNGNGQNTTMIMEAVGKAYRAGQLSDRAIAEKYGISNDTVSTWAKRYEWVRDLSSDVRVEAKRRSMAGEVVKQRTTTEEGRERYAKGEVQQAKAAAAEAVKNMPSAEIVDEFSSLGAAVLDTHRGQIGVLRNHAGSLARELMALKKYYKLVAKAIDGTGTSDNVDRAGAGMDLPRAIYKVRFLGVQLAKQTQMTLQLTQAMAKIIPLERQSYALDSAESEKSYESMLEDLYNSYPTLEHDGEPIH